MIILACDKPALQRSKRRYAGEKDKRQARYEMNPERWGVLYFDPAGERGRRNAGEADNEECGTVGRIGKRQIQSAGRAIFFEREEPVEDLTFAATRAEAAQADLHR